MSKCHRSLAFIVLVSGCAKPAPTTSPPAEPPWFEECAAARGLDFQHRSGHETTFLLPEIMGGGVALIDMDDDGDLDVYFVQSGSLHAPASPEAANQLFRNDGTGSFEAVTGAGDLGDRGYGMGVIAGDYDADGDTDLYVTNVGANVLLRNDGGRFTDVTEEAGVGDDGWGTSGAFLDFDRDGDLDLFVTNYIRWSPQMELTCYNETGGQDYCSPKNYTAPAPDVLYRNEGDGTFENVTSGAGLADQFGNGLGVVAGDFTNDGWVDIFVANDGTPDQLWVNGGDGTFVDEAMLRGCAVDLDGAPKAGMGVAAADIDDDADLDLLVVNLRNESDSFYRNEPGGFVEATATMGLGTGSRPFTRFGLGLADFDNDGWLDLYQANGRVQQVTPHYGDDPYAEPNLLWRGTPAGRLVRVDGLRGGTDPEIFATSRGAAFGDIDNDGCLDVVVVNRDGPARLLRGLVSPDRHWIVFRVTDAAGADAIGATVELQVGARRIVRDCRSAYSYCAANDPRVHVGLGAAAEVSSVTVTWADGIRERFGDYDANQIITLRRGHGRG